MLIILEIMTVQEQSTVIDHKDSGGLVSRKISRVITLWVEGLLVDATFHWLPCHHSTVKRV